MTTATKRPRPKTAGLPMPALLYNATDTADVVTVPARAVLAIENKGAPESTVFQESVGAVYGLAYTLKFARKKQGGRDFKIGPLEAQWWAVDPARHLLDVPRSEWCWELRLALPDDATEEELAAAVEAARTKKGGKLERSPVALRAQLNRLPATRYGRVLHVGPYAEEQRSFDKILEALEAVGATPRNRHLEVYLSDPRRSQPENLKTVLLLESR
jgi:hypothetical protein